MLPFEQRAEEAEKRLPQLKRLLASCRLCPRECRVRRYRGELGECGLTSELFISSSHLHPGEEPAISGHRGSGTVFFAGCNLACLYCQNYPISQLRSGKYESAIEVAERFLELQNLGAHNINLVTPTPQVTGIIQALIVAWRKGLTIPVVYNCGGYERTEVLRFLDGLIDIYLADMKYGSDEDGRISGIDNYFTRASAALELMFDQTGELVMDEDDVALHGVIVRHLVIPGMLDSTEKVLHFLADRFGNALHISLMSQYYPSYLARKDTKLGRHLKAEEYERAVSTLHSLGLSNGWVQPAP